MNKNVFDIIDKQKLDIVSESIENAHGLPNECYLDGPYTKIERKKIFEDKWVTIGTASSVPNPGDTKPFDLLGIPLIIIRDKKNKTLGYLFGWYIDKDFQINNIAVLSSHQRKGIAREMINNIIKVNSKR